MITILRNASSRCFNAPSLGSPLVSSVSAAKMASRVDKETCMPSPSSSSGLAAPELLGKSGGGGGGKIELIELLLVDGGGGGGGSMQLLLFMA